MEGNLFSEAQLKKVSTSIVLDLGETEQGAAEKKEAKKHAADSLWTNPLDCPFGKRGARYAFAGRKWDFPLLGILSARAPDPFPKRAGDLSALRMAAACRGLARDEFRVVVNGLGCLI